ncbi:TlpA family protein disulfide reductase [Citrobacter freundii]|uniref:TlpA family protein disulfide reductase n=1 Tax=Citrobacter freundii complex TaxID=1344959 RepID=UPI0006515B67|nr:MULTISPECIES: TlpA disulfide reductase family protein [Citrobacter freundii complex]EKU6814592.1 TlpA family protein disulfide reductase [Citrobacter freundii]MBE0073179.1 TlpA family protein disulfide reductase [Citrobacter freundii]MDE9681596.1 TlpA family protein disulfide reductase [Citrobacter freundii]MEA8841636.1 TlpA disulfide reductase family protein [Citrobacter freundii]MEA8847926.1 TlpA disulfide reductase family protein [Citrobacter freundii]
MRWINVLTFAILVLISGCKEEKLVVGQQAPALATFDLQGGKAGLERWRGKAIYLNFWSAGCGGCLAEMDALEALSKKWGDNVVVVAVNTDPATVNIDDLLVKHQVSYPVLRDQLKISQERYQVIGTPTSVLIDRDGRVLELHQGMRKPPELDATFARLAAR